MTSHQMLAKVRDLAPLSTAAVDLVCLLNRPDTSNQEVVSILKEDAVLTAKLLRACNSPALGLQEQIGSVDQAVLLLGHTRIFQMLLAMAVRDRLSQPLAGYAMEAGGLWRHSLLGGTAAELAVAHGLELDVDNSTAFTIGLLHDIGKLVTSRFLTRETLIAMRQHIAEGSSVVEAERAVWGTDHAEVGAGLIYLWRLPEHLVEAVALHHRPVMQPRPGLSALACLANGLAHRAAGAQLQRHSRSLELEAQVLEALSLSPEDVESLQGRVWEAMAGAEAIVLAS